MIDIQCISLVAIIHYHVTNYFAIANITLFYEFGEEYKEPDKNHEIIKPM